MNWLPPPGPQRRRLVVLVMITVVVAGVSWYLNRSQPIIIPQTTGPQPASNLAVTQARATAARQRADTSTPQALKLAEMEQIPDEPHPSRNPFQWGTRPAPPPPPQPAYTPPVYTPPAPPPPPPPPQVKLRLTTTIPDPATPGRYRAYLADPDSGAVFEAFEGDVVDGRYKVHAVGRDSAVVSFADGTGRRTLLIGR
jgi:hypothetical protein